VRIVGGLWKRSRLPVVGTPGLRPSPDRVRETLFNWLGQDLAGWRVLDAFAGTGALGFEAASRGASEVLLIERDATAAAALEETRQRLKADAVRLHRGDALSWMSRAAAGSFDLVLLDPPWDAGLLAPALAASTRLLAPQGILYLEAPAWPPTPEGWRIHRQARAGTVHYGLLQKA
jgi:16S rRNA (guanine(966)-N(2))-methyltransferase RsmD